MMTNLQKTLGIGLSVGILGSVVIFLSPNETRDTEVKLGIDPTDGSDPVAGSNWHPKNGEEDQRERLTSLAAPVLLSQAIDAATGEPRGAAEYRGVTIDLGETPPIYRFALESEWGAMLVGEKNTRHRFEKALHLIQPAGREGEAIRELALVSIPRNVEIASGFLIEAGDGRVKRVGVLVPDQDVRHAEFSIRIGGQLRGLGDLQLEPIPPLGVDRFIVLESGVDHKASAVFWVTDELL